MGQIPRLPEVDVFRLKAMLREMSFHKLYQLADEYQVEIPIDALDIFSIVDGLVDGLKPDSQWELLKKYGDAGRKSTYVYISKERTPSANQLYKNALRLLQIKNDSLVLEDHPYYEDVEIDNENNSLKIRFHYLHGLTVTIDESGKQREQHFKYSGVAVYRQDSRLLEIRSHHKAIADKIASTTPVQLKLAQFSTVNLMDETLIGSFVDWIRSLNSANIELATTDAIAGSLRITARKGMDLKTADKFYKELKTGQLRGGHVTIDHDKIGVNFRINFRDCHITYTLFTSEAEISYVLNAIEKIMEGYHFEKPKRLLEFFGKQN